MKVEPDCLQQTVSSTSTQQQEATACRQNLPSCTSPVLFEEGQDDKPVDETADKPVDNAANVAVTEKEQDIKKKPIFKKRNSLSAQKTKVKKEPVETSKHEDNNIDEANDITEGADDFKEVTNGKRKINPATRGNVDKVVDKVKQGRKKSDDVVQDTSDVRNAVDEIVAASGEYFSLNCSIQII